MTAIAFVKYTALPQLDVARSVALGTALLSAVPEKAPEYLLECAQGIESAVANMKTDWTLRENFDKQARRTAGRKVDQALRAMYTALRGVGQLGAGPRSDAAARLLGLLFPSGLSFTQKAHRAKWAETQWRLDLIKKEGLVQQLCLALGGREHHRGVVVAQRQFGQVLGIDAPAEQAVNLRHRLNQLRQAIQSYALLIIAWSRTRDGDTERARAALLPIDEARADRARRRGARNGSGTVEESASDERRAENEPPVSEEEQASEPVDAIAVATRAPEEQQEKSAIASGALPLSDARFRVPELASPELSLRDHEPDPPWELTQKA